MNRQEIYLDWNSTTPMLPSVVEAMTAAAPELWGNPSSVHGAGRRAREVVESTRERVATTLRVHPRDVVFTSGGTEANNLALSSAECLVLSAIEHPSVTQVAERLLRRGGRVEWITVEQSGVVDLGSLERCLQAVRSETEVTVALMAANHETGILQPVEEAATLCKSARARLHVDAVQALGKVPLPWLDSADTIAVTAHKIRGPKGIGALAFRGRTPLPVLVGGEQERGLRPGTQDALAALGFDLALQHAAGALRSYQALAALRDRLELRLSSVAIVNGAGPRLPHVSNLALGDFPGPEMVAALDLLGVRVSSGSACSAGTSEPSKVIEAMHGRQRAAASLRFSLGPETTNDQVDSAIAALFQVLGANA